MRHVTSGLRRLATRLRPDPSDPGHPGYPTTVATAFRRRSLATVERLRAIARRSPSLRPPTPGTRRRSAAHPPSSITARLRAPVGWLVRRLSVAGGRSWGDIGIGRLASRERAVPVVVASLVLLASVLSVAPAAGRPGTGNAAAAGATPRLVLGGGLLALPGRGVRGSGFRRRRGVGGPGGGYRPP